MIGFGLWIAVLVNGEVYEAVPAVYDTYQECVEAEKLYTRDIIEDSACYKGLFVELK